MPKGIAIGGSHHGIVLDYGAPVFKVVAKGPIPDTVFADLEVTATSPLPQMETYYAHAIHNNITPISFWSLHQDFITAFKELLSFAISRPVKSFTEIDYQGAYGRSYSIPPIHPKVQEVLDQEHIPGLFDTGEPVEK